MAIKHAFTSAKSDPADATLIKPSNWNADHTAQSAFEFVIDGGGSAISTGVAGDIECPFTGTIASVRMFADQTGSIVVDVWRDSYANYPPTDADSITSATPPTISSAVKSQDTSLSGWTTAFTEGDILRLNVDSCTSITRCLISITVTEP